MDEQFFFSGSRPPPHKYKVGERVKITAPRMFTDPDGINGLVVEVLERFYIDFVPFYAVQLPMMEQGHHAAIQEDFLTKASPKVESAPELGDWDTIEELLKTDIRKD